LTEPKQGRAGEWYGLFLERIGERSRKETKDIFAWKGESAQVRRPVRDAPAEESQVGRLLLKSKKPEFV